MDYFQGFVSEYLRANRSTFVNPEFMLQINAEEREPAKGTSWYVDFLAANFNEKAVYLCEVTYSQSHAGLLKKLPVWDALWLEICGAIRRDANIPSDWKFRPWVFIREEAVSKIIPSLITLSIKPRITPLEMTLPWRYNSFNRLGEKTKPDVIPLEMV